MRELWEEINIVTIIAVSGFVGTLITSYIVWKTDRPRLRHLEEDRDKMRVDFEQHKVDNLKTFEKIMDRMSESNKEVVEKIDELKWYLIHGKINQKGKDE